MTVAEIARTQSPMTLETKTTIDLLRTRRSVVANSLGEPGPDEGELEQILTAGIRVPDHGKIGPWRLQVLGKPAQADLGDLLAEEFLAKFPEANDKQVAFERNRPQRAPSLIVVSSRLKREHKIPEIEQLLSCGAVCTNLLNASVALGYSAQWLTEWPAYNDRVKATLGVPEDQHIVGLIYIGTAIEAPSERTRPGLETVVAYPQSLAVSPEDDT